VGVLFGIIEHLHTYPTEGPDFLSGRIVVHVFFVIVGFVSCHVFWMKGVGVASGTWMGFALGILSHFMSNYISILRSALA
jgi:hypothetical protein